MWWNVMVVCIWLKDVVGVIEKECIIGEKFL